MGKKVMSKQYMLDNRDEILAKYNAPQKKSKRAPVLCKKERKVLGIGRDQGKAIVKNIRINPKKVNLTVRTIKGKPLDEALAILEYTNQSVAPVLSKLVKSAEANAVNNNGMSRDALYIADCFANPGPVLKRIRAKSRGSATRILKRTSHITVVLKEKE